MACFLERDDYICHIMQMKQWDADYAREALIWYDQQLPDMRLMEGVRAALRAESGRNADTDRVDTESGGVRGRGNR